jgi:hypothetical protein
MSVLGGGGGGGPPQPVSVWEFQIPEIYKCSSHSFLEFELGFVICWSQSRSSDYLASLSANFSLICIQNPDVKRGYKLIAGHVF